jgi:two-component system NtrC family sensor kinase
MAGRDASGPVAVVIGEPIAPDPGSASERLVLGDEVVHIPDVVDTEAYRSGVPSRLRFVDVTGARTALWVALRKNDVLIGDLSMYRQEVRPFTEKQIALLQNFAAQAVIAMENARLFDELRGRTRDLQESLIYQTATSDVLKVISRSGAELESVLQSLLETAARLCNAENAIIFRLQHNRLQVAAWFGFNDPEMRNFVIRNPFVLDRSTLAGRAALDRRIVHVEDVEKDPDHSIKLRPHGQYRTALAVPLLREDTLLGAIGLTRSRVEAFTEKQIALVTTFADQAVIAIENARLLGELRQRTEEVAELNRGLEARVAEQVEELGRVGRLKRFLAPQLAEFDRLAGR